MRHSELPPVLDVIVVDGHEIAIHYAALGRTCAVTMCVVYHKIALHYKR